MDFSSVKEGDVIKYIGDSWAYGGTYTTVTAQSTYSNPDSCPRNEQGRLMIIEFMNDGTPMFFTLDQLSPGEWELVN
ncbi:hypothetical protein A4A36_07370 [Bacillus subtilis]|uniref:hypothetical protein n=1 Tax=Bacillus stercoris TaxID=2054641 RepID=UPI0008FB2AA1|nr:hypothetical protein A4A35_16325 [Bacillus subtilis]OIS62673.1 hypothetical protein A4A36_07370 [Bacillus subtilis]OIS68764.1 hypothetical protein A4A37_01680 [Bacillus subtilis]